MSGGDHVILSSQLTGICSLAKAVFEMRWEYRPCCLLFKRGGPSCFVPLGMTNITVSGSSASQSQTSMLQAVAVASGSRSSEGSASRLQTSSHPASIQMFTGAKSSFRHQVNRLSQRVLVSLKTSKCNSLNQNLLK